MGANTSCGHYVCHIKKDGKWALFNDRKARAPAARAHRHSHTLARRRRQLLCVFVCAHLREPRRCLRCVGWVAFGGCGRCLAVVAGLAGLAVVAADGPLCVLRWRCRRARPSSWATFTSTRGKTEPPPTATPPPPSVPRPRALVAMGAPCHLGTPWRQAEGHAR
eukprot:5918409-Prymnesium_polylepis.2